MCQCLLPMHFPFRGADAKHSIHAVQHSKTETQRDKERERERERKRETAREREREREKRWRE